MPSPSSPSHTMPTHPSSSPRRPPPMPLAALVHLTRRLRRAVAKRKKRPTEIRIPPPLPSPSTTPTTPRFRFDHTRIPPELWFRVMREATAMVPDPLDATQGLSFLEPEHSHASQREAYRESMDMKLTFALVSRRWATLSRELLFEYVRISHAAQAKTLAHTLLMEYVQGVNTSSGYYIRSLHIDTRVFDRCAAIDIRTILDYAPRLVIYTDRMSVRQNNFEAVDPRCSPERIFSVLAHSRKALKRLSWQNYDQTPFPLHMNSLFAQPSILTYLEITSYSPEYAANSLEPHLTQGPQVVLPALKALKAELDDYTFGIIASWDMPSLTALFVVSCEFNYSGCGFASFFQAHGPRLEQLELGHSSSLIESRTLGSLSDSVWSDKPFTLADWCPNLKQFICSADAEWQWQTPDWIPPHVLLPSHPSLTLIGIRGIHSRLSEMTDTFTLLEQLSSLRRAAFPSLRFIRDLSEESHLMRTCRPDARILTFWTTLVKRCNEQGVWLEDMNGLNITNRALKRASLDVRW